MAVEYEWCVETHSTDPETGETLVENHDWCDTFARCLECIAHPVHMDDATGIDLRYAVVLVRHDYRCADEWAYMDMESMQLPSHFKDAYDDYECSKVPKRYHQEVAKAITAATK